VSITVDGTVRRNRFRLDAELEVPTGTRLALIGMNGAGKSTLLRAVAGLHRLAEGTIELGGRVVDDPDGGIFVEPEHRRVGYVPQDTALFPHLSAEANVAFGPRRRGESRPEAQRIAAHWLARVDLADQAARRPGQLSGGQARRVALARALAVDPDVLLLDEPLASLDVDARSSLRRLLRDDLVAAARTTVLVTHDPVDALVLADQVAVVEEGRVLQSGPPGDVIARPRSPFVARLVGLNLLEGTGAGRTLVLGGGGVVQAAEPVPPRALAAVPPRAVTLHRTEPEGSSRNVWPATVTAIEPVGDRVRVTLDGAVPLVAEITAQSATDLGLVPGVAVWSSLKATEVEVYPV
jgi:molybdate transport system ATP-binding protein